MEEGKEVKEEVKIEDKKTEEEQWYLHKVVENIERPYISPEQMYEIGRKFGEKVFSDSRIVPKIKNSGMIITFKYCDEKWPNVYPEVTVDTTQEPIKLYTGPCEVKPTVVMKMHADTAHRFWMQKLNLMIAITKGLIKVKGPIPQIMRLLPTIKPSYELYKEVLKEMGHIELLNYPKDKKEKG